MPRRVVITGVGLVTALGSGADHVLDELLACRSGIRPVEVEGIGEIPAARVPDADSDAEERFGRRVARRMDRASRLAAIAADDALRDAGPLELDPGRVGAAVGSAHGGAATIAQGQTTLEQRGADRVGPLTIPLGLVNAPAASVARTAGLRGPSLAPATACAAGADAVGQALILIREGRADAMVAGGADAPLVPVVVAGYLSSGALAPADARPAESVSRPFDVGRSGFVIGEGAAALVLEERERALARGARIYAELVGYGASCDAGHLTDPEPEGIGPGVAIATALADAALVAEDVEVVSAHATSTTAGDRAEARALAKAGLADAAVFAAKGAVGHALGGAGAIEAALSALAVARGAVPPTLNLETTEEDDPLRSHVREPRIGEVTTVASTSFGFGGANACLILRRDGAAG